MKYKNYKDEILESNFGTIVEGKNTGKRSYVLSYEIKSVEINGKFVANPGYDLTKVKDAIIESIRTNEKFRLDIVIYGVVDQMIADETNTKVKAVYKMLKDDAVARLVEYKQQIINNS